MVGEDDETLGCATIITLSVFFQSHGFCQCHVHQGATARDAEHVWVLNLDAGRHTGDLSLSLSIEMIRHIYILYIYSTGGNGIDLHVIECVLLRLMKVKK